ncbi:hypothetical protein [Frankia sp. QA3]|uniref:hypothetical protein n=1 Tax=Frankia sp. QA3 TaxID=710111 RepID=UPI000269C8EF|nr:hypothetical protein [Frankia sp. QA3]EIV93713.1 hypothetical protein FraQA3DRAFT_3425 [Frankia sp. QA3]
MVRGARRRVLGTGIAALALLWAAACGGSDPATGLPALPSGTVAPASPPRPSPTPTGVAPATYQQVLTGLDTALTPDFTAVSGAQTPTDLSGALRTAAADLTTQRTTLERTAPPVRARAAHGQLVAALLALGTDLDSLRADADRQVLCTGSSGGRRASAGNGAHLTRLAVAALATADSTNPYRVGSFLPAGQPDQTRRPDNGSIGPGRRGGYGKLTVEAPASHDAVVKLTEGGARVRNIFVRGGSSTTVDGLPDGSFDVFYTLGEDWDTDAARFTRNCSFSKFDSGVAFTTRRLSTSIQYRTYRLTLFAVAGGNATSVPVPAAQFPAS